ncbi:probable G-protein coupled receptor Mth-like 14 [Uranotaenia lowii]|uniref:probable G-protein coupled receptor Mth-like 14 n=1 Tax=Uranotaenia lowii TaxID=190385 RepID=UPI00247945C6|nr:probable G-protein coupled receptor Mth-like 14 [Uranotaenia lowii]
MKSAEILCLLWLITGVTSVSDLETEGSGASGITVDFAISRKLVKDLGVAHIDPSVEDGIYPEDDDDYVEFAEDNHLKPTTLSEPLEHNQTDTSLSPEESIQGQQSSDVNLLVPLAVSNDDVNGTAPADTADIAIQRTEAEPLSCNGYKKLSSQPQYTGTGANLLRKCCPHGESFQLPSGKSSQGLICGPGEPFGEFSVQPISAQFYDGCIEDLEPEPPLKLQMAYGNPCPFEGGMVRFGLETKDRVFIIQNGSLLIINDEVMEFDIYNGYCLDVNRKDGNLTAYVCPSEIRMGRDIFKGQMVALALCLMVAIPLLLATAFLYVAIPAFNDIHGEALSLNCINFAVALLLESIFQHQTRGHGSTDDTVVLANYAEYFILATFFWLLVNCLNNCIHAWYFLPRGIQIKQVGEKRTFFLYLAFAQLTPLAIILSNPPNGDTTATKNYFFIPIMCIIALNLLSFAISFWGLHRVSNQLINNYIQRGRLSNTGSEAAYAALQQIPNVSRSAVDRVKYMTKYTAMLFIVMAGVWTITIATYYSTKMIPILFDILFGLQGILIFIIFICLPRPFRTVKAWFQKNGHCGCKPDSDEVDLRRHGAAYRNSRNGANGQQDKGGAKELVLLNNVQSA